MRKDILVCGVGGQGTVLAAKLISAAARECGIPVRSAETIGMAQRGGPVTSHVRLGEGVWSPLVPMGGADVLLAFEPWEAVRELGRLKRGGLVVVCRDVVPPPSAALGGGMKRSAAGSVPGQGQGEKSAAVDANAAPLARLVVVSRSELLAPGEEKCLNVALLGVAVGTGATGIPAEAVRAAIRQGVKARFVDMNLAVFEKGLAQGKGKGVGNET